MPRSTQRILNAADDLADRFEAYEPTSADHRDPAPLAAMRDAVGARARAEQQVVDAVAAARKARYSWAAIGTVRGTSGEAARQRYGQFVDN